jgi:hypothetical protein
LLGLEEVEVVLFGETEGLAPVVVQLDLPEVVCQIVMVVPVVLVAPWAAVGLEVAEVLECPLWRHSA